MSENTNEEEISYRIKKKFITNSIFGHKLINNLSANKKREVNIDYFLSHIKHLNEQKKENYEEKIDYKKHIESIPKNIYDKLNHESEIVVKNKNHIEPYCKEQIQIISPVDLFKKFGFHYKLVKLESQYYDLFSILYFNHSIVGYICCKKRTASEYKNLYIVLSLKYHPDFFDKKNKKLSIINEITEEIAFFEKDTYTKYLHHFRKQIYSIILDILSENKSIKYIICIGEEEGGNILQLLLVDFINNKNDILMKYPDELSYYLFTHNTAMLSTETFYNDLINYLGSKNNAMICCFDDKNDAYQTWDPNPEKTFKYNFVLLKKYE